MIELSISYSPNVGIALFLIFFKIMKNRLKTFKRNIATVAALPNS